jgi:hypothetical protein
MADPLPQAPHQPTRHPSRAHSATRSMADVVGSAACPWRSLGMPRCPPSPALQGQGSPPGQATGKGRTMTEAAVSVAGNLIDQPESAPPGVGSPRARFRAAVSGRRDQEASCFTVVVRRGQAEHAAGSWSKGSRVVVVGRLQQRSCTPRTAAPARPSRSWPRSWGRACAGRRQPRPGRRGIGTTSQLDQRSGGAGRGQPRSRTR